MAQGLFYVKLINKGRTIEATVQAHTQPEAKKFAENMYPGYRAMTAQRVG
jgi:hypothetical protein